MGKVGKSKEKWLIVGKSGENWGKVVRSGEKWRKQNWKKLEKVAESGGKW